MTDPLSTLDRLPPRDSERLPDRRGAGDEGMEDRTSYYELLNTIKRRLQQKGSNMKQDYTDISIVLDRSGSMEAVASDTIGGFNQFIEDQKKLPGECKLTLAQFDDVYEVVHNGVGIQSVPPLTKETYVPRASTALLDAIGRTINATGKRLGAMPEDQRPGKVLFVIMTDGQENASREFNRDKVFGMISTQRDTFKWQFIFLGANQDAISAATSMGIAAGSSLTYAANSGGTRAALHAVSRSTTRYRAAVGADASADFDDEDRTSQAKQGVK